MFKKFKLPVFLENILIEQNVLALLLFFVIFVLLFIPIWHGEGQYWDNSFPFFSDQLGNYFSLHSYTWSSLDNFGTPLSYNSDYWFRFVISRFSFFEPEHVLYFFYVLSFTVSSFFTYLLFPKNHKITGFLIGVGVVINSAIFYNFFAGFFDYICSYLFFIILIYFLLKKFTGSLRDYVLIGVLIGLGGMELQFYVIDVLVVIMYLIVNRKLASIKGCITSLALIGLLNLVWLSNFLVGASSLSSTGLSASMVAFSGAMITQPLNIFDFSFSQATQIYRTYSFVNPILFLSFFALVFIFLYIKILKKEQLDKNIIFFIISFLIFIFLDTGYFNTLQIWPIDIFYPVFRESGHFAALIVFFFLSIFGYLLISMPRSLKVIGYLVLVIFLVINIYPYETENHAFSYSMARSEFQPYKEFIDNNVQDGGIVVYPFWEQYAFTSIPIKFSTNQYPLNNTGWDSFTPYAGVDFLNDNVQPYQGPDSIQLQLLQNYNVTTLQKMGITYIFDLSNIYESYWDVYVPPSSYDDNLSYVKNNPAFVSKIISTNGNNVTKINDQIIKINNPAPLISGNSLISYQKINNTKYVITLNPNATTTGLSFLQNYHPDWKLYETSNTPNFWWDDLLFIFHPVSISSHSYAFNNFGNQWTFTGKPGETRIILYFEPQIYQNIAIVIFFLTMFVCLGTIFNLPNGLKRVRNLLNRKSSVVKH